MEGKKRVSITRTLFGGKCCYPRKALHTVSPTPAGSIDFRDKSREIVSRGKLQQFPAMILVAAKRRASSHCRPSLDNRDDLKRLFEQHELVAGNDDDPWVATFDCPCFNHLILFPATRKYNRLGGGHINECLTTDKWSLTCASQRKRRSKRGMEIATYQTERRPVSEQKETHGHLTRSEPGTVVL